MKARETWRSISRAILFRPGLYFLMTFQETLVFSGAPLITGLLVRGIFNALSGSTSAGANVWTLCVLIVAVSVTRALIFMTNFYTFGYHQETILAWLRKNLLNAVMAKPGAQGIPISSGDAVSRFRGDVEAIGRLLEKINFLIEWSIFAVAGILIMVRVHSRITVFVLVPLAVVILSVSLARRKLAMYRNEARSAAGGVTGFIGEIFGAVQAIKVAGAESRIMNRFQDLNDKRRGAQVKDDLFRSIVNSISWNSVSLGTGIMLLFAADAMGSGTFTVGDFALFVVYLERVGEFTAHVGEFLAMYRQTGVSLDRLRLFFRGSHPDELVESGPVHLHGELPPATTSFGAAESFKRIDIRDLAYSHPDHSFALENISFSVSRSEFVVVTGRIGSGKTTLLRVLLGLLSKKAGAIAWNGQEIEDPSRFFVPPNSAYVPQVPVLFSDTIRQNILLGKTDDGLSIDKIVDLAVLREDIAMITEGIETTVGVKGVRLSGGQRQRIAIARMLAGQAELNLCDDLSSALDVETETQLWKGLLSDKGRTYLVVSHRRFVLKRADRILLMKDGRIEDQGSLSDLLNRSDEMNRIWGSHSPG